LLLIGQSIGSPASIESDNLFAYARAARVQQFHFSSYADIMQTARELKSNVWTDYRLPTKLFATARSFILKNIILFIYSHSSAIPANSVKIDQVDVQIIGLTVSLKITRSSAIAE